MDVLNQLVIEKAEYHFEYLVGFYNGFYKDVPPFNFILVYDEYMGVERIFALEEVQLEIKSNLG